MSDRTTHKIDHETFHGGAIILAVCLVAAPFLTIIGALALFPLDGGDAIAIFLLVPGLIGLAGIPFGLWAVRVPTGKATLHIDGDGLVLTLRGGGTLSIPWSDTAEWGVEPRRWNWTTSMVVWPAADAAPATRDAASRLWSRRYGGWVVEAMEPPDELVADFERFATCPRRAAGPS